MKNEIYISARFIIALLILSSCKSIKSSDFNIKPDDDISKLSNLSIKFDENNLTSRYSISTSVASSYSNNRSAVGTGTSFLDKRVEDFKLICDRETKENLCVLGKPNGTIKYKIITAETKNTGIGWSILSGVTLGIPNLFGMPFGRLKTEIEIEAEIIDCEGNLIGTFKGYGKQKVFCAAYYGYRGGGEPGYNFAASRKSNIEATKKAMKEIKVKIKSQKNELENLLINCKR